MIAYYNEIDPYAAQWLRNLIGAGHIPHGDVDERSIKDVQPSDLDGYMQCHFFAGIGGWAYALRLAEWPDERPVWTGSCPCQPFSSAGKRRGFDDERHLWPDWFRLIQQRRPPIIFGEQVAAAIGRGWLDAVFTDLEAESYACGAAVLPACGVGAPHIRQRCWFMADARHALPPRREFQVNPAKNGNRQTALLDAYGAVAWTDCDWLPCIDGKARPVEPGSFPLAHGIPARVGKLRAYGNAIVPQLGALFVVTACRAIGELSEW